MPPKTPSAFACTECGWTTGKWVGRCGECQAWGTVDAVGGSSRSGRTSAAPVSSPAVPIAQVAATEAAAVGSGIPELDRVLGGGVVAGAVMLMAGEPGVGKSTLLLEVAARWARAGRRTLYVSGEESAAQVRLRAERTGALADELFLAAETDLGGLLTHIDAVKPSLLIVDSVQTIGSSAIDGVPGGVTQVREVAATVIGRAKAEGIATLLVGHVTKDGSVAGPRVLEHLVDVVLQFEGDRTSRLRLLRATKNRFGPVDEIGCFDLVDAGIVEVPDPTGLFVSRHESPVPGTCVTVTMEGRRPLLAEVQALTVAATTPSPRRSSSGLDSSRVAMLLAVLSKTGVALGNQDVYTASVGGARLHEPAVDLAVALAVISAAGGSPLPGGLVALGEVGLAGEVRPVRGLEARLREAARIGFTHAIVPRGTEDLQRVGLNVLRTGDLAAALRALP
ncbi:DNA repair protein RadA [Aeromicrobium sp. 636]|uniref:DNA repair protein RadA n=1 Tax=Aeromicrobium senzhongii TaxID=2663859 RepID=A0A8I0EVQ8_9ACTN|nr:MULTISPECIES: DNA repair protein RadA [Aeromicrobium]MBC9227296.1 DNA repair protein RadA [Aeromicrobium senzhongii]MCQ3999394.1 DNA repair protein RadA [Aeromicrobium sp. 636]MTB88294.1 DNA repair protein RadA [Aeromicrobium senzhongii]QNL94727.1 DNA repair protein RadA [Aeromicrobium senzhongii]